MFESIEYFFKKCTENDIPIYGNQHGVNKSIIQILFIPNKYCKLWLTEGKWMIDRYKEVLGIPAIENRWYTLGSPSHYHTYKSFKWNIKKANKRVLIIHEPDLRSAEGDRYPHNSEYIIDEIIRNCKILSIQCELKVHPNWKGSIGNDGLPIKQFDCPYVDLNQNEITNYSLVIGSRSSLLYESYLMGIPTLSIQSSSKWKDDKISFLELGIINSIPINKIEKGILDNINKPKKIDLNKIKLLSGDFSSDIVREYIDFIKEDCNKNTTLPSHIYKKYKKGILKSTDSRWLASLKHKILHKITILQPGLYKYLRFLR